MAKYQIELKRSAVEYYKKHGKAATMKKYGISNTALYKWVQQYNTDGEDGLKRKETKRYSVAEKKEIIDFMKHHGPSETYKQYKVRPTLVNNWERKLLEKGEVALSIDNRGRKPKYPIKNNVNENEDLLEEVQRLRMENAYLKKLRALVQEREEKLKKKK